ncbi:hypothetical protein EYF80_015287 [Liparis tanakae]|uniref:Secreted protein n=1 Tax=Liparis tanakae TaxID=230148 RepID=A0A4Z2I999_9TELE|nr:hypothetical protein EYF80_015287 [Liparis tanakae]
MFTQAFIFTFPLTLWMGSTTTATARSESASKLCCVLMSTPDNQQPKPGHLKRYLAKPWHPPSEPQQPVHVEIWETDAFWRRPTQRNNGWVDK